MHQRRGKLRRNPQIDARVVECRRHHADDRVLSAAEQKMFREDVRTPLEAPRPQLIADDGRRRSAAQVFLRDGRAPDRRRNPEYGEVAR